MVHYVEFDVNGSVGQSVWPIMFIMKQWATSRITEINDEHTQTHTGLIVHAFFKFSHLPSIFV